MCQALSKAWKDACTCKEESEIVVPNGLFYLSQMKFEGPCKAPSITFRLQGTLQAHIDPTKTQVGEWITFQYIDFLTIGGGGTFDGQGTKAWTQNNCHKTQSCTKFPYVSHNNTIQGFQKYIHLYINVMKFVAI